MRNSINVTKIESVSLSPLSHPLSLSLSLSLSIQQKAVEENRVEREKQIDMEKRQQEKGISISTKQKVSKPAHLQHEGQEDLDFREELKQKSNRGINVASLEERLGSKSTAKYSPRQQDFRHLLRRQTDHSRVDSNTTANGTLRAAAAVNHHKRQQRQQQVEEEEEGRSTGVLHGSQRQRGRQPQGIPSTSHQRHQHWIGPGHDRNRGLEERDLNYDFETQF